MKLLFMNLLLILLGGAISMARAPQYPATLTPEHRDTLKSEKTLQTDKGLFTEPGYNLRNHNSLEQLRDLLTKKSKTELNLVMPTSESLPMSRFQLIVDTKGSVISCTILESTDMSKDKTVSNFLQNGTFFQSPATLNGTPCNSLGILSIRYSRTAPNIEGFDMEFKFYPLIGTND